MCSNVATRFAKPLMCATNVSTGLGEAERKNAVPPVSGTAPDDSGVGRHCPIAEGI